MKNRLICGILALLLLAGAASLSACAPKKAPAAAARGSSDAESFLASCIDYTERYVINMALTDDSCDRFLKSLSEPYDDLECIIGCGSYESFLKYQGKTLSLTHEYLDNASVVTASFHKDSGVPLPSSAAFGAPLLVSDLTQAEYRRVINGVSVSLCDFRDQGLLVFTYGSERLPAGIRAAKAKRVSVWLQFALEDGALTGFDVWCSLSDKEPETAPENTMPSESLRIVVKNGAAVVEIAAGRPRILHDGSSDGETELSSEVFPAFFRLIHGRTVFHLPDDCVKTDHFILCYTDDSSGETVEREYLLSFCGDGADLFHNGVYQCSFRLTEDEIAQFFAEISLPGLSEFDPSAASANEL